MFTGIVEGTGTVVERLPRDGGERLVLDLRAIDGSGWALGQSVAVDGVCLTLVEVDPARAAFDLAGETLQVTKLGRLEVGQAVNVERAMRVGGRLDGHWVQGHVDGLGRIRSFEREGDDWWLVVEAPAPILAQILPRGSITVDGISLTAARLEEAAFHCTIVPHTREVTNLREARAGSPVNLETDVLGKWVRRMVETGSLPGPTAAGA